MLFLFGGVTLKITEEIIPHIEKALGLVLYDHQKKYLLEQGSLLSGRANGKTVAHCIKLALSTGESLNMNKPHEFSDYGDGSIRYAQSFYMHEFMKVREKLKGYGFPVRGIRNEN